MLKVSMGVCVVALKLWPFFNSKSTFSTHIKIPAKRDEHETTIYACFIKRYCRQAFRNPSSSSSSSAASAHTIFGWAAAAGVFFAHFTESFSPWAIMWVVCCVYMLSEWAHKSYINSAAAASAATVVYYSNPSRNKPKSALCAIIIN